MAARKPTWTRDLNNWWAMAPPMSAAAMLSRKLEMTNTITSSTKPPFQSSGRNLGSTTGTWLFSKCRARMAKPVSRQNRLDRVTHSWPRWPKKTGHPHPGFETGEQDLVKADGGQPPQGHVEGGVMEKRHPQEGQGKQDEIHRQAPPPSADRRRRRRPARRRAGKKAANDSYRQIPKTREARF